jgi:ferric-dicitrate binding protein FerR (iron transport regulator)
MEGSSSIITQAVSTEKYIAWKNNIIHFEKTSVREAAEVLESWFNVEIEIENSALENCEITAKYSDESLENILRSFQFMLKTDYTLQGQHVVLTGKGCK